MEITLSEHVVRIQVVAPSGRVDAFSVPALSEQFHKLLADGHSQFVVDLSDVSFLDSAGIAALVTLLKRSRQASGNVKLVWPSDSNAQRILRLTKFDRVFDMFDDAASALPH